MKGSSYREQDYAFGQIMLTLRSRIGLTQGGLAEYLGVSRRSVADWEAGSKYPKPEHLQALIVLAFKQGALPNGGEADAIRSIWKAARQKLLLDEGWVSSLVGDKQAADTSERRPYHEAALPAGTRVDWNNALSVQAFYGREWELGMLTDWVVAEHCRIISVLGMGGIGKSALTVNLMRQSAHHFAVVIWRSLRDAPSCEALIDDLLRVFTPSALREVDTLDQRITLLIETLRENRTLIVLDNAESLMEEIDSGGRMRPGYEGYTRLFNHIAQQDHQSTLLLTSREKPHDLMTMEGMHSLVRSLRLARLDAESCGQLLTEKGLTGTPAERTRLIESYAGNPLALKIVTQTVIDLFGGEIALFLEQGEIIFGGVRALLAEQFGRLSALEQNVMLWLAILREPSSLNDLLAVQTTPVPRGRLMEAIEGLYRHSLIERGKKPGSFTLQSVVLEYLTGQLIANMGDEIEQGQFERLAQHGLELAHSPENVRQTQERLIVKPLLSLLTSASPSTDEIESKLTAMLGELRLKPEAVQGYALQGYAAANLLALLRLLNGHLNGLDLSGLVLRSVFLQGVDMRNTRLSNALIRECAFTDNFDGVTSLGIGGDYWAVSTLIGEVRIWTAQGRILHHMLIDGTESIMRIALSPDGQTLVGACISGSCKLWDVASGNLILETARDFGANRVIWIAFSPDGSRFAGSCSDGYVRVWDRTTGSLLMSLLHKPYAPSIAWHPDSTMIATGDIEGVLRIWSIAEPTEPVVLHTINAHTQPVVGIAFSPDGTLLASGCWDSIVKIWHTADASLRDTLTGHPDSVHRVIWSHDGRLLATSGETGTLWLWDVETRAYKMSLRGHKMSIRGLVFVPGSDDLVSGSTDGVIRVWNMLTGECVRIIHSYADSVLDIAWASDSTKLVSGNSNGQMVIFDVTDSSTRVLRGNGGAGMQVSWSADGRFVTNNNFGTSIHLWDAVTGKEVKGFSASNEAAGGFESVVWSPEGQWLASVINGMEIYLFDAVTHAPTFFAKHLPFEITMIKWSPDGTMLAGTLDRNGICVWDGATGAVLHQLTDDSPTWDYAWSTDSTKLAKIGSEGSNWQIILWDLETGETLPLTHGHVDRIRSLDWSADDEFLITYDDERFIRWWDSQTGVCVRQLQRDVNAFVKLSPDRTMIACANQNGFIELFDARTAELLNVFHSDRPYERMDISGIRGLTDAQKMTLRSLGAVENS